MSYDPEKIGFADTKKLSLRDGRRLDLLNRKERQAWKARHSGEELMQVNLLTAVEAQDADGTMILNGEKKAPPLKEILLYALRAPHQSDQHTGFKEKNERYLIIKRINAVDSLDLSEGEVRMILDRVGKMYLQVELVGRVAEILSGGEKCAPPEEKKA